MKKTLLFLLFTLSLFSATARVFSVRAILNGANVVPANATTATGTLTGTFDDVTGVLNYTIAHNVQLSELSENFGYGVGTGAAGANGGVFQFDFATTNPFSNSITVPDITNLLTGNNYVIVLNEDESSIIRGQIIIGIEIFNFTARHAFYSIGGYSYTQQTFPIGIQTNPYVVSGPSPQNDFSYAVSAIGGIKNISTAISTNTTNTPIVIQFNGNNVRKFSCQPIALNELGNIRNDDILFTATTNLGNTATQTGGFFSGAFVGFSVTGENEYLVSIIASFPTTPSPSAFITIGGIMVGDNSPQNVALNFDGVDDYVSTNEDVGNFGTNDNFTVTCWIKPDALQSAFYGENDIISKWAGLGAGANNNYPFVIRYLNQNLADVNLRGKILVGQWDGTNFPTIISTTAVNDGNWHHVAFVKTGTLLKLYIDGEQEGGDVTDNATNTTNNSTPLQFGRRGNGENHFKGEIDEIRIWNIDKTQAIIQTSRFCKDPDSNFMVASYNASNGVPHGNNILISQVTEASNSANNGILNNFAKTGDASNFVTGQVKYVNAFAAFGLNNGSSWVNAFTNLQSALPANTCNDLFDVHVSANTYKPAVSDINASFNIPTGMRLYGGFEGTEKSINQRNMALIHSDNETTLSGDLLGNDILSNFNQNRTDNSRQIIKIQNADDVIIDGFSIRGGSATVIPKNVGGGIFANGSNNITIKNCKIFDNEAIFEGAGIYARNIENLYIYNSYLVGNKSPFEGEAINFTSIFGISNLKMNNCIVAGHTGDAIYTDAQGDAILYQTYTNCTFTNNFRSIYSAVNRGGSPVGSATSNLFLNNSIVYGNTNQNTYSTGGGSGTFNQKISYSLIQGETSTTNGNLVGTTNPQFVNPVYTNPTNAGNYRLKDFSPCINTGTDVGVSPLDLDRNPRPKGGKTDMGAYESNVNMNEIISIATGNWENNSTWNLNRVPLATDKVIMNGHTVTVTTNTAKAKIIEQKPSSDLKFNVGGSLELKQ